MTYCILLITILPSMLVLLMFLDFVYMALNLVLLIIKMFSYCICIDSSPLKTYEAIFDNMFHKHIGLCHNDVEGFRKQRTILQLQLESIPQIVYQTILLIQIKQIRNSKQDKNLDIGLYAVLFSLICAFVHLFLEIVNIYFEAETSDSFFVDYLVACYNARQGWVPQQKDFYNNSVKPIEFDNKNKDFKSLIFCNQSIGYSIVFEFTNKSFVILEDLISILPKMENGKRRKTVKLGHCIEQLSVDRVIELCNISYQRVNLEFTDTKMLKRMVEKDTQLMIDMT